MLRSDQDVDVKEKIATIDDLHSRLKTNVDSVQHLSGQVRSPLHPVQNRSEIKFNN